MSHFSHNVDVKCPDCQPLAQSFLECCERNYSGCGVDMAYCPECGHGFQISYKVSEVLRTESWDGPSRVVREAEEEEDRRRQAAEQLLQDTHEYERLKKKLGIK